MQRPRHFRRDGDMFTYPETSSRDALSEPSRKRKSSYDHRRHMPAPARSTGFNRRAGPKSYANDFRDKEFQSSIPDSSRRESSHFRDNDDLRDKDFRGSIQASPPRRASSHFRDFHDLRDNEFQSSNPASPCRDSHLRDYDDLRDKEFRRFIPASPRRQSSRFRGYDDLRDKEFQRSIPAAPHRESSHFRDSRLRDKEFRSCIPVSSRRQPSQFRDYPRKTHSWDKKNYAESCHSDKSDDYYSTKSEYTEHGSFRGRTYPKDSPPLSVGQSHRTSKWTASMMENSHQFGHFEANAQKAKDKSVSHFPKLWDHHGPEKPDQMEAFTSSCHDQSSCKIIGKCQDSKTGDFGVNIHGRDHQTCSGSRWSPSRAEASTHESNAHVATEDKASDFEEFWNSEAQKPKPEQMASSSCDIGSKILKESQSLEQDLHEAVRFDKTGWETRTVWPHEHCDPESNREQHASNFDEFGPQHLESSSHEQAPLNMKASQSFKPNLCSTGSLGVHVDARSYNEETHKSGSSSTISGFDNIKMFGDSVPSSQDDLQNETNRLLQNALRLLSAASGIVSADNSGGKQVQTQDDVKIMKLLLECGIQNLKHSLVDTTVSKSIEASPKFDECGLSNEEQDSVRLDDQCKLENKASAFTEKLWDGTLQLSTAVSVSAVAFFKSGEKMQDFSWSGSVEVKGKVRLEAFEKYVQDLPRSRSRGLMVVSFCCKDGSSDKGLKGMNEIAEKYKERRKVGFAQVSNGVDLYICPHSDAVITILAKHGFFKGMAAVRDKSDPLIGCVVWRKNPCSILPALKNNMELESMANKKNEEVSGGGATKGDKHLETSNMELDKLNNVQPPTVADNSAASDDDDDDDDLPEYDFGAACLGNQNSNFVAVDSAEKLRDSGVPRPLSTLTGSESSGLGRTIPDSHFQGGIGQHSPSLSLAMQPQKQIRECKESSKPADEHLQGPVPQKQSVGGCKPSSLFDDEDDDDIPEWCPPGFTKPSVDLELVAKEGAGSSSSSIMVTHSHSKVADSNSRPAAAAAAVVPPLPPTPPPAHLQLQLQTKQYPTCAAPLPLPLLPTSSIPNIPNNPPPPGFLHHSNHPAFLQNHAPRPRFDPGHAARPPFDPRGFAKPPHHSPWRPSPSGSGP